MSVIGGVKVGKGALTYLENKAAEFGITVAEIDHGTIKTLIDSYYKELLAEIAADPFKPSEITDRSKDEGNIKKLKKIIAAFEELSLNKKDFIRVLNDTRIYLLRIYHYRGEDSLVLEEAEKCQDLTEEQNERIKPLVEAARAKDKVAPKEYFGRYKPQTSSKPAKILGEEVLSSAEQKELDKIISDSGGLKLADILLMYSTDTKRGLLKLHREYKEAEEAIKKQTSSSAPKTESKPAGSSEQKTGAPPKIEALLIQPVAGLESDSYGASEHYSYSRLGSMKLVACYTKENHDFVRVHLQFIEGFSGIDLENLKKIKKELNSRLEGKGDAEYLHTSLYLTFKSHDPLVVVDSCEDIFKRYLSPETFRVLREAVQTAEISSGFASVSNLDSEENKSIPQPKSNQIKITSGSDKSSAAEQSGMSLPGKITCKISTLFPKNADTFAEKCKLALKGKGFSMEKINIVQHDSGATFTGSNSDLLEVIDLCKTEFEQFFFGGINIMALSYRHFKVLKQGILTHTGSQILEFLSDTTPILSISGNPGAADMIGSKESKSSDLDQKENEQKLISDKEIDEAYHAFGKIYSKKEIREQLLASRQEQKTQVIVTAGKVLGQDIKDYQQIVDENSAKGAGIYLKKFLGWYSPEQENVLNEIIKLNESKLAAVPIGITDPMLQAQNASKNSGESSHTGAKPRELDLGWKIGDYDEIVDSRNSEAGQVFFNNFKEVINDDELALLLSIGVDISAVAEEKAEKSKNEKLSTKLIAGSDQLSVSEKAKLLSLDEIGPELTTTLHSSDPAFPALFQQENSQLACAMVESPDAASPSVLGQKSKPSAQNPKESKAPAAERVQRSLQPKFSLGTGSRATATDSSVPFQFGSFFEQGSSFSLTPATVSSGKDKHWESAMPSFEDLHDKATACKAKQDWVGAKNYAEQGLKIPNLTADKIFAFEFIIKSVKLFMPEIASTSPKPP